MTEWHFYALATGLLIPGRHFTGSADDALLNAPEGHAPIAGVTDAMSQRLDLELGQLVDYQPPAPPDDALRTWRWDETARRWLITPTLHARQQAARAERDQRLAACDWVTARAIDLGQPVPAPWAAYRQQLRDVTAQPGFPSVIEWPVAPNE